jgi:tetraacyldisaccharide 4'-kinase
MTYEARDLYSLRENKPLALSVFKSKKVHAVAGLGNPERFFKRLQKEGIEIIPHIFPDHYAFSKKDLLFKEDYPIIMTEKDAVKCKDFAEDNYWVLPVTPKVSQAFDEKLLARIRACSHLTIFKGVEHDG